MQNIDINRLKWRSRRSMLELDLVFDKFIQSGGLEQLSSIDRDVYAKLLELDDSDLQLIFQGYASNETEMFIPLVQKIVRSGRIVKS